MALPFSFHGQHVADNNYIPENLPSIEHYLSQISAKQQNRATGKYASKIKKVFTEHEKKMKTAITDSVYFFNEDLNKNLEVILNEIYSSNPVINHGDYYFFIKNSIVPNAGCYGDGSFEINLGLFTTYNSDDELAYVICHEIAHKILDHSYKKLNDVMSTFNSKETKEEIRKVEKTKYGRTRAGLTLLDGLNSDFLQHSKEAEVEADSLGYIFFQNTGYQPKSAVSALEKLKITDGSYFDFPIKLDSIFDFKSYPFKAYWLEEEVPLFEVSEEIDDFSFASAKEKTHPEIDFRIDKIQEGFSIDDSGKVSNLSINEINKITSIQSITYAIDLNLLDLAFYQLVRKFEQGTIGESYYYETMAKVLRRTYTAKKNHELGKYVPRKNNLSDEKELNKIRLFLHNLELGEIRRISLAFCETNLSKQPDNKPLKLTYDFFKR